MTLKPIVTLASLGVLASVFLPWIQAPVLGTVSLYDAARPAVEQYRELADLGLGDLAQQVLEATPWQVQVFVGSFLAAALTFLTSILHLGPRIWAFLAGGAAALTCLVLAMQGQDALAAIGLPLELPSLDPMELWELLPLGPKVYVGCGALLLLLAIFAPASQHYRN